MNKRVALAFLLMLPWSIGVSQDMQKIDSLKHELEISQNDTMKLFHFILLAETYEEISPDSSFYYAKSALTLARKLKFRLIEGLAMNQMAYALKNKGNYPASLQSHLSAKEIVESVDAQENILPDKYLQAEGFIKKPVTTRMIQLQILGNIQISLGLLYESAYNYDKGLYYMLLAKQSFDEAGNVYNLCQGNMVLGRLYLSLKKEDSALIFEQMAYDLAIQWDYRYNLASILLNLGRIHLALGNRPLAAEHFRESLKESRKSVYFRGMVAGNLMLNLIYQQEGKNDSSLYFAREALAVAQYLNSPDLLLRTYTALASFYSSSGKNDSTVKYQSLIIKINDSFFNSKQTQQFQNIDFDEQQRHQEIEDAKKDYRDRLQIYGLLMGLAIFILVAIILFQSNRHKQKAYLLLQKQKQETDFQKTKVEQTLEDLKATQSQLIQSEKMASLGELTAGIAHEIQNPLNFVNNFSEVNTELIEEMEMEITKENQEEIKKLAKDIRENNAKITQHGKRADAIVKSMLQHSKISSGNKEPTDINVLADEYLRLSYYGFLAKDKTFNATIQTDFDESLGKINIIPQEIGRVLLNLYNNAFYAVHARSSAMASAYAKAPADKLAKDEASAFADASADKLATGSAVLEKTATDEYYPLVSVSTQRDKGIREICIIRVKDNGNGIPQKVLDKIFQPFFTTKPAGQGTGLGLSLSYDIIKAHGGELKVVTKEGEGAEFIIELPIK